MASGKASGIVARSMWSRQRTRPIDSASSGKSWSRSWLVQTTTLVPSTTPRPVRTAPAATSSTGVRQRKVTPCSASQRAIAGAASRGSTCRSCARCAPPRTVSGSTGTAAAISAASASRTSAPESRYSSSTAISSGRRATTWAPRSRAVKPASCASVSQRRRASWAYPAASPLCGVTQAWPKFRTLAPTTAPARSTTATRAPCRSASYAMPSPTMPAPTTTMSYRSVSGWWSVSVSSAVRAERGMETFRAVRDAGPVRTSQLSQATGGAGFRPGAHGVDGR
ncbi:hypothetical protein CURTO8I2_170077 [Curtobacterium sp. 8I-2]|nr:hypothetical protein CURTO8I2_170077 [Curtobacterium sp. 8I-2]